MTTFQRITSQLMVLLFFDCYSNIASKTCPHIETKKPVLTNQNWLFIFSDIMRGTVLRLQHPHKALLNSQSGLIA